MATLREIRRRISGIKNTQKITKAMKMVAAAKLRRAQEAVVAARPYARKMKGILRHLARKVDVTAHPLFAEREVTSVALIVVTGDRGLCGAFNGNIIRTTATHIRKNYPALAAAGKVKLICIGKKGSDYFVKNHYAIIGKHIGIFSGLQFKRVQEIVAGVTQGYLRGEFGRVEIIYNEFKSIAQQRLIIEQMLPIPSTEEPGDTAVMRRADYIYEPSGSDIIAGLVPRHLNFQIWRVLLESNAAEQGARMAAMDNATTNAAEFIETLQLSYNKARQASITKELLEIVSGAEALKKAG